jgi:hypothetical protein
MYRKRHIMGAKGKGCEIFEGITGRDSGRFQGPMRMGSGFRDMHPNLYVR